MVHRGDELRPNSYGIGSTGHGSISGESTRTPWSFGPKEARQWLGEKYLEAPKVPFQGGEEALESALLTGYAELLTGSLFELLQKFSTYPVDIPVTSFGTGIKEILGINSYVGAIF